MKREQLEHIIRASGAIVNESEFYVIGSQSILGQYPDAPESLLVSNEADIICKIDPEKSELIEGAIGELSHFHELHGYYAQGVDFETAKLPEGWENRCFAIKNENTNHNIAYCLELHDTCISKFIANRPKDLEYIKECIRANLVEKDILIERLHLTEVSETQRDIIETKINSYYSE